MNRGIALIFGPVVDPQGVYGFGIIAVDNEEDEEVIKKNDPALAINRCEFDPMMVVAPKPINNNTIN
jgi:hypothetical protein